MYSKDDSKKIFVNFNFSSLAFPPPELPPILGSDNEVALALNESKSENREVIKILIILFLISLHVVIIFS